MIQKLKVLVETINIEQTNFGINQTKFIFWNCKVAHVWDSPTWNYV
jgi:hypothetical protein